MIMTAINKAIEAQVPSLAGKIFPIDVVLNEQEPPLCVAVSSGKTAFRAMSGKVHHYSEKITMDILARTQDECSDLYDAIEATLYTLPRSLGILRLACMQGEPDAKILPENLIRRTMTIDTDWKE